MKKQIENPIRKTNRFAIVSLVAGLLSLIIYLSFGILIYLGNFDDLFFAVFAVSKLGGILLGMIGLYSSEKAFKQVIEEGDDTKKSYRIINIGKVLSIFGIIVNIIILILLRD